MAATLTVTATTPYSAQLRLETTAGGEYAYLRKSGATGGDADLTSLAAGPLRACLERSANWSTLTSKLIVRLTMEGVFSAVNAQTFAVAGAIATSAFAAWANTYVGFGSVAGACTVTMELRYLASNQR